MSEPELVRHYALTRAEFETIAWHRRDPNRLGFALQLCALRYPSRLLRPGETIPAVVVSASLMLKRLGSYPPPERARARAARARPP